MYVSRLLLIILREVLVPWRCVHIELFRIGHGIRALPLYRPDIKHGIPPQVEEGRVLHLVIPHCI
jgi:hypothetical protein